MNIARKFYSFILDKYETISLFKNVKLMTSDHCTESANGTRSAVKVDMCREDAPPIIYSTE